MTISRSCDTEWPLTSEVTTFAPEVVSARFLNDGSCVAVITDLLDAEHSPKMQEALCAHELVAVQNVRPIQCHWPVRSDLVGGFAAAVADAKAIGVDLSNFLRTYDDGHLCTLTWVRPEDVDDLAPLGVKNFILPLFVCGVGCVGALAVLANRNRRVTVETPLEDDRPPPKGPFADSTPIKRLRATDEKSRREKSAAAKRRARNEQDAIHAPRPRREPQGTLEPLNSSDSEWRDAGWLGVLTCQTSSSEVSSAHPGSRPGSTEV